jgi:hypothetical protein
MATPSNECGVIEARPSSATYISPLDVPIFYSFKVADLIPPLSLFFIAVLESYNPLLS